MKKRLIFLAVVLFLLIAPDFVSSAKVDSQIFEKLNENQEVSVIVMLKDELAAPKGLSDLGKSEKVQALEQKKAMIKEQQDKVLSRLNLKDKDGNLIKLNAEGYASTSSSDLDFTLRHKYSTVNGFSGTVTEQGLEKLMNDPDIEKVYLNSVKHISLDDSVPQINGDNVWKLKLNNTNITGKDETICIIDTGIDTNHSAFTGRILSQYCYCNITNYGSGGCCPNNETEDTSAEDDNGHGTHCAGIAAGNHSTYKGVAPEAGIISIKVCNSTSTCDDGDIIAGIDWCVNNATTYNISVISMSLGGDISYSNYCNNDAFAPAINSAVGQNILVVVASGNYEWTNGISSPACVQNATPVGASDGTSVASFSNRNNITNLLAPGVSICSARLPGDNDGSICGDGTFISKSGTSMSAPHVAGAAALLKQFVRLYNGTDITPQEIEDVLNNTGTEIDDTSGSGRNYSRIDVYAAILSLDTTPPNVTFVNITPENETITSNTFIFVNVTINDFLNNISSCLLEWNHTSNESMTKVGNGSSVYCYKNKSIVGTGIFYYKAYANDSANNIGVSELRQINITNTAPNATNVTIDSTDYLNRSNGTLVGLWSFYDANSDNQGDNETRWYNNSIEVTTLANLTSVGSENTTKDQNWTFSVRVFDGTEWSEWVNSTILTIENSAPTQPGLTNPANNSYTNTTPITMNWTASTDADSDNVSYYLLINGTQACHTNDTNYSYNPIEEGYYEWHVTPYDGAENGTSSLSGFYTYDIIKPIITNITNSSVTSSGATLTVTTNENASCAYNNTNSSVEYASMTAFSTTDGTSHSTSLTGLSASTSYTYYVRCIDAAGNVMNFSNSTTFTTSAASTSSSGGGGGTPTVTYEQKSLGTLAAGSTKVVTFTKSATLAVTEITVTIKNKVTNAKIKVDAGSLPSGTSNPSTKGSVYKYIEITKTGMTDNDITKGIIKFKVKKEWLTEKGYGKDTVTLHRYYTNQWSKLTTTRDSEETAYYYYSAESTGFSTFAITAEKAPATQTTKKVTTKEVTTKEQEKNVTETLPEEKILTQEKWFNFSNILKNVQFKINWLFMVIIIAVIFIAYFIQKKWNVLNISIGMESEAIIAITTKMKKTEKLIEEGNIDYAKKTYKKVLKIYDLMPVKERKWVYKEIQSLYTKIKNKGK
ncbi:hypothetical protein COS79_03535 [Candidatus Woesearchaeota archaeon CG06_land_8_20_14_3_00_33_13]|nr:MAG: hypothetical protein COS79_03535 [Candidatus Woesearchaeota archaeon CG06_land_8_20_14_3_00_33_13]